MYIISSTLGTWEKTRNMLNKMESNIIFPKRIFKLSFFGQEKDYNFNKLNLLYSFNKYLFSTCYIADPDYTTVKNIICVFEV